MTVYVHLVNIHLAVCQVSVIYVCKKQSYISFKQYKLTANFMSTFKSGACADARLFLKIGNFPAGLILAWYKTVHKVGFPKWRTVKEKACKLPYFTHIPFVGYKWPTWKTFYVDLWMSGNDLITPGIAAMMHKRSSRLSFVWVGFDQI